MIDSIETTGPVTRVRVICDDEETAVNLALDAWQGLGDYDEVVALEQGVFEVIISN